MKDHKKSHTDVDTEIGGLNTLLEGLLINNKEISSVVKVSFNCENCYETFASKTSLKNHTKRANKM